MTSVRSQDQRHRLNGVESSLECCSSVPETQYSRPTRGTECIQVVEDAFVCLFSAEYKKARAVGWGKFFFLVDGVWFLSLFFFKIMKRCFPHQMERDMK